jgi:predicted PolB exonuclease-like 3'-5' exonuclease
MQKNTPQQHLSLQDKYVLIEKLYRSIENEQYEHEAPIKQWQINVLEQREKAYDGTSADWVDAQQALDNLGKAK